jgi:hypothetical protein
MNQPGGIKPYLFLKLTWKALHALQFVFIKTGFTFIARKNTFYLNIRSLLAAALKQCLTGLSKFN